MSTSSDTPCGDIACYCCYPELHCWCTDRPMGVEVGTVYECPTCCKVSVCVEPSEHTLRFQDALGVRGQATSWRRLTAPTRIPGSAP